MIFHHVTSRIIQTKQLKEPLRGCVRTGDWFQPDISNCDFTTRGAIDVVVTLSFIIQPLAPGSLDPVWFGHKPSDCNQWLGGKIASPLSQYWVSFVDCGKIRCGRWSLMFLAGWGRRSAGLLLASPRMCRPGRFSVLPSFTYFATASTIRSTWLRRGFSSPVSTSQTTRDVSHGFGATCSPGCGLRLTPVGFWMRRWCWFISPPAGVFPSWWAAVGWALLAGDVLSFFLF